VAAPVAMVFALAAPLFFVVPRKHRLKTLILLAILTGLPGVAQVAFALLSSEPSLCPNVLPRCLKAGPCLISNVISLLVVSIPLALLAGLLALRRYVQPTQVAGPP